ncbi:hypothetical protein Gotur_015427 [Gossypium turneri]
MMTILVQTGLKKLCLTNTVLQEVLMEKTSSAVWKRLETLYATKSLANRLVLKQRLFAFRMNEDELLRDRISQFITLLNDLKKIEVYIDDEDHIILLFTPFIQVFQGDPDLWQRQNLVRRYERSFVE